MADIGFRNVHKSYGPVEVLHDVNLDIEDGEFAVLVGPSGCGKSTLLRMIAGLETITGGEISVGGEVVNDLPPRDRDLAMVFQSYALYPHMDVARNMGFSLEIRKQDKTRSQSLVAQAAQTLGLDGLLGRLPRALSGGQRQRVAMGRAIVRQPKAFLFDEPLSNLDAALRVGMRFEIAKLHQTLGATMIYVTHDQVEAMTLADRIVVMNAGRIEQVGSPLELYERPANLFVSRFIGSPKMNIMPCEATEDGLPLRGGRTLRPDGWSSGLRPVTIGARPEHIRLVGPSEADCVGRAVVTEHLGSDTFVYVDVPGWEPLIVRQRGNVEIQPGSELGIGFDPEHVYMFSAEEACLHA